MRPRDRITLVASMGALGLGVFAVGGGFRWVVVAIALLSAVAAASQVHSRRKLVGTSPLLVLIGAAAVLTAIQLVPLPGFVVAALNPTGYELVADGQALLHGASGSERGWHPVSMDPPNTRVELAKLCAYFLLAWMALRAAASERGRYRLLATVAGITGAVALTGIVHELLDADRLFGVFAPTHASPVIMSPLLNANHLACLMVLGALVASGLALHEHRAPPVRALWILVSLLCLGVALATRSRGAVVGLGAGATVMAVTIVLQRLRASREAERRDVLRIVVPAAVILLCSLVLVVYLGGGEVRHDLEATQLAELHDPRSKYAAWSSTLQLVQEAPVLGTGRGAFEAAFTRVHPSSGHVIFSHVENQYLQIVVDWGIGGAILIAAALGFAALVVVRRAARGALAAAAIGGLAAVGIHSIVDFGLEIPGLAIPTLLVASTLLYVPLKESSRTPKQVALRSCAVGATVIVGLIAATPLARTLTEDHAGFQDAPASLADARASLDRHPLDYLSAAHVSRASIVPGDRVAFVNHALRLHPTHPGLHRVVAGWLAATGRIKQAALEYRLALVGSGQPEPLVAEILKVFPNTVDAVDALPVSHWMWGRIVTALTDSKRHDLALAYLVRIADQDAHPDRDVWRRIYALADKLDDLAVLERAAREFVRRDASVAATIALARVQLRRNEYDAAIQTLEPVVREVVISIEHVDAHLLLCEVYMGRTDWPAARTCLIAVLQAPAASLSMRRRIHGRLAKVEEALGNTERAAFERRLAGGDDSAGGNLQ